MGHFTVMDWLCYAAFKQDYQKLSATKLLSLYEDHVGSDL